MHSARWLLLQQAEIDPMTGEEVQTGVSQILATPPDVIDVVRSAMGGSK